MILSASRLCVVSFLRESLLTTLRVVVESRHDLHVVRRLDELDGVLHAARADVAVIDPELVTERGLIELLDVLDRHIRLRVISYTTVSPSAMRAQMALAVRGYRHLVVRGIDDLPAQFRTLLEDFHGDALGHALVTCLRPALNRLSPGVGRAIEQLFRAPATVDSVEALTRLAGLRHRRRLYEALIRGGWQPSWTLLRAARVVRAYAYLAQGGMRVRDVAHELGYATARGLAQEVRAVAGYLPSVLLRELGPEEFLERVATGVLRSPAIVEPSATSVVLGDQPVSREAEIPGATWPHQLRATHSPHQ